MTHRQLRKQLREIGITPDTCGMRDGKADGNNCIFLYRNGAEEAFTGLKDYLEPSDYRMHIEWLQERFA